MARIVGVMGATSMVGQSLLPLLTNAEWRVRAFSRQAQMPQSLTKINKGVAFRNYAMTATDELEKIPDWICLAPIWALPDHFPMLTAYQAKRVVALSSTSIFTIRILHIRPSKVRLKN